jgi:hypothetical protein
MNVEASDPGTDSVFFLAQFRGPDHRLLVWVYCEERCTCTADPFRAGCTTRRIGADPTGSGWLTETSRLTGPNGGNIPSRDHRVQNEVKDLRRPYRGGAEIVGLAGGIFRSSTGPANNPPDLAWVENEYARIALDSRSRRAILIGFTRVSASEIFLITTTE